MKDLIKYIEFPIVNAVRSQFNWSQYSDVATIVASKYQLYLPSELQLIAEVEKVKKEWEESR